MCVRAHTRAHTGTHRHIHTYKHTHIFKFLTLEKKEFKGIYTLGGGGGLRQGEEGEGVSKSWGPAVFQSQPTTSCRY